jgi:hypothetical protein
VLSSDFGVLLSLRPVEPVSWAEAMPIDDANAADAMNGHNFMAVSSEALNLCAKMRHAILPRLTAKSCDHRMDLSGHMAPTA